MKVIFLHVSPHRLRMYILFLYYVNKINQKYVETKLFNPYIVYNNINDNNNNKIKKKVIKGKLTVQFIFEKISSYERCNFRLI